MKAQKVIILAALFFLCAWVYGFAQDFTVIVHPDNPNGDISARELRKIFLGEKTVWPDGQSIKLAVLKSGEDHKEFLKAIVKMNPVKFTVHWKQKIFTGGGTGTYINFFNSDDKVKEFIKENPTAIGYISTNSMDTTVKAVKIEE